MIVGDGDNAFYRNESGGMSNNLRTSDYGDSVVVILIIFRRSSSDDFLVVSVHCDIWWV